MKNDIDNEQEISQYDDLSLEIVKPDNITNLDRIKELFSLINSVTNDEKMLIATEMNRLAKALK